MPRLLQELECHGPCPSLRLDELHLHWYTRLTVRAENSSTLGKAHLVAQRSAVGLSEAIDVLQHSITACRKVR